ncbi:deaminase [Dechloromonas denitrificans]|uniref:Deaminase n=1 Tax=Dechloromonas denitrificans TaxID=281362 RepID=A0A133XL27_9RHOO|nr:dihydrofolate reductase family protein [Dechloromonas denitrificans]KXB31633.1 deaminase [Dechloromonas denitrificans]
MPTSKPRVSVFIATSLDGFIARPNGELDWLERGNAVVPPGEDCGYQAFMASVDVLVIGRLTYEKVLSFGDWPYASQRVIVLSSGKQVRPAPAPYVVESSNEAPRQLLARLHSEGCRHVHLDGGLTIQGFLREGLVDELTITTIPVLLGSGRPLFGPVNQDMPFRLTASQSFAFGFVQNTYLRSNS